MFFQIETPRIIEAETREDVHKMLVDLRRALEAAGVKPSDTNRLTAEVIGTFEHQESLLVYDRSNPHQAGVYSSLIAVQNSAFLHRDSLTFIDIGVKAVAARHPDGSIASVDVISGSEADPLVTTILFQAEDSRPRIKGQVA